jgi:hypothetical protein
MKMRKSLFYITLIASQINVTAFAAEQRITAQAGQTISIPILVKNSDARCNIDIIINGVRERRIVEPPGYQTSINFTSNAIGESKIYWEGKNYFRGSRSAVACQDNGTIVVYVTSNDEARLEKWTRLLNGLKPLHSRCVEIVAEASGINFKKSDAASTIYDPADSLVRGVVNICSDFKDISESQIDPNQPAFSCTVESYRFAQCKSFLVEKNRESNSVLQPISFETAARNLANGRYWRLVTVETEESKNQRLEAKRDREAKELAEREAQHKKQQAEQRDREEKAAIERAALQEKTRLEHAIIEEQLKTATAARVLAEEKARLAKLEAEEKERAWKSSPEYRAQQEELARLEKERKEEEQRRIASEQAKREEVRRQAEAEAKAEAERKEAEKNRLEQMARAESERIAKANAEQQQQIYIGERMSECVATLSFLMIFSKDNPELMSQLVEYIGRAKSHAIKRISVGRFEEVKDLHLSRHINNAKLQRAKYPPIIFQETKSCIVAVNDLDR